MRRLLVAAGTAVSTLVASCGPSQEQWKGYEQCISDTSDKVKCARKNDIDEKLSIKQAKNRSWWFESTWVIAQAKGVPRAATYPISTLELMTITQTD